MALFFNKAKKLNNALNQNILYPKKTDRKWKKDVLKTTIYHQKDPNT